MTKAFLLKYGQHEVGQLSCCSLRELQEDEAQQEKERFLSVFFLFVCFLASFSIPPPELQAELFREEMLFSHEFNFFNVVFYLLIKVHKETHLKPSL